MTNKRTILYVGGFILPDKNAAAHRVISIAKILRRLGYQVVFFNETPDAADHVKIKKYYDFPCYEIKKKQDWVSLAKNMCDISNVFRYLNEHADVFAVIAYNYPAVALNRLRKVCRKRKVRCFADVTEWYSVKHKSPVYKLVKGLDVWYRMRYVQKRLDGDIVISNYLESYYRPYLPVINIPPLVDKEDQKWILPHMAHKGIQLIYAGSPSAEKEKLDSVVETVGMLLEDCDVYLEIIGITREQFLLMYDFDQEQLEQYKNISFLGRIPHTEVLQRISNADYSILIRNDNRVTRAGFPTKFVESVSCGIPVIANDNSNIQQFIQNGHNGILLKNQSLQQVLCSILKRNDLQQVDSDCFDFRKYIRPMSIFLEQFKDG